MSNIKQAEFTPSKLFTSLVGKLDAASKKKVEAELAELDKIGKDGITSDELVLFEEGSDELKELLIGQSELSSTEIDATFKKARTELDKAIVVEDDASRPGNVNAQEAGAFLQTPLTAWNKFSGEQGLSNSQYFGPLTSFITAFGKSIGMDLSSSIPTTGTTTPNTAPVNNVQNNFMQQMLMSMLMSMFGMNFGGSNSSLGTSGVTNTGSRSGDFMTELITASTGSVPS